MKINKNGLINLSSLILYWCQLLDCKLKSSKCAFYLIASKLSEMKCSTLEFIYRQNLNLKQEININEFNINIIDQLRISNSISIVAFRALDILHRGKIKIEDFVIVIDSYRSDFKKNDQPDKQNKNDNDDIKCKFNLKDEEIFWIIKFCYFIKEIDITEKMAFDAAKIQENASEINLDTFKRKIKVLSNDKLTALELNHISDAFDVNHNRFINYDDYCEVVNSAKQNSKFVMLYNNNFNTYPLIEYFSSQDNNISKLPFRTNQKYFSNSQNNDAVIDTTKQKQNNFEVDEAYNEGTNLAGGFIDNQPPPIINNEEKVEKEIIEFLKELDVFESGEWSLIELLEDFDIINGAEYSPSYELFVKLENKFCPTIAKTKISFCLNAIDSNSDGYISYLDIINFLLKYIKHRSSKVGWKEVTRSIIYTMNLSADEFFTKNIKSATNSGYVSLVEFTKVMSGTFSIDPSVAKTMYDDLQSILSNRKITCGDIIDTVNRQLEYNRKKNKQKQIISEISEDTDDNYAKTNYMSSLSRDTANNFNAVSLLDKKYYENEMKNFVRLLQRAFVPSRDPNQNETLIANLQSFLKLPSKMKLSQFRELFIKPLSMNYSLGISTFQLCRVFTSTSHSDTLASITSESLMSLISSYIDYNIIDFEPKLFIYYLENAKYPPLKYCFESLEYSKDGVSCIELLRLCEMFYPKIPKNLLFGVVKKIDTFKKGKVSYKNLCDFLFRFSSLSENQFSAELMLRHIASLIDCMKRDTDKYLSKYFADKKIIYVDDVEEFFSDKINFSQDQIDHFFLYLCDVKGKKAFSRKKLITLIDRIRTERSEEEIDSQKVYAINDIRVKSKSISQLLLSMNSVISLQEILNSLSPSLEPESQSIPVAEMRIVFTQKYLNKVDIDNETLLKMLKQCDEKHIGMISYVKLHKYIKSHLSSQFTSAPKMHITYLAYKIKKDFNDKFNDYLHYKSINGNKYVTKNTFETMFKVDECLNDGDIVNDLFDMLKETSGQNKDKVYLQNYIDIIRGIYRDRFGNYDIDNMEYINLNEKDSNDIVIDTINKLDERGIKITDIYDEINFAISVNSFAKINWITVKQLFSSILSIDDVRTLSAFKCAFCKVPQLYDLLKFCDVILAHSKFAKSLDDIKKKIIEMHINKSLMSHCKSFNLDHERALSVCDFIAYFNALFNMTNFESFVVFRHIGINEMNPRVEDLKLSMKNAISLLKLKNAFEKEEIEDKNAPVSPLVNLALSRLATQLRQGGKLRQKFESYDVNKDKNLQRDEIMQLILDCEIEGINEDMIAKIIEYIDVNNDGDINYEEFISFLIKFDEEGEYEQNTPAKVSEKVSEEPKPEEKEEEENVLDNEFKTIIKFDELTNNYNFNKTQMDSSLMTETQRVIIKIQENLIDSAIDDQSSSLEYKLYMAAKEKGDSNTYIPIKEFGNLVINAITQALNDEIVLSLIKFCEEESKTQVDYKKFISKVYTYVFSPDAKQKSNDVVKTKLNIQAKLNQKFKKRNRQFGQYLKKNFGKEFNLNNENEVAELKTSLLKTFSFSEKQTVAKSGIAPQNLYSFKKFMSNIVEAQDIKIFSDYQYNDDDFFKRPYPPNEKVETILNSEEAALKKCEELFFSIPKNELFIDNDFGSINTKKSLYINAIPSNQFSPDDIDWYHIKDISQNPSFMESYNSANEVIQGALGNCWFISALAVIASKDYLLRGEFNETILDDGVIDEEEVKMLSCGVYPPIFHHFRSKGIYCFKFYKNYKWRYVIIDDRLPCLKVNDVSIEHPRLIYGKCRNNNEFWVSLIEKAYAKLHGCYEKLNSGFIDDAIQDLTGLNTRRILLGEEIFKDNERYIDFTWNQILDYTSDFHSAQNNILTKFSTVKSLINNLLLNKNNSILGCVIDSKGRAQEDVIYNGDKSGLISGHAYAILKAFEIPKPESLKERKTSRLLLLKNPWGVKEWNGKWSDNSEETENKKNFILRALKVKLPPKTQKSENISEDGRFLISYSDFRNIFSKLFIGFQFSPKFISFYFDDTWCDGNSGGIPVENTEHNNTEWAKNPQYYLSTTKDTTIFMSLQQEDGRMNDDRFPFVGSLEETCLILIRVKGKERLKSFASTERVYVSPLRRHRENSHALKIEKGEYIISCCSRNENSNKKFRLWLWVEDFFKDDQVNQENFMEKLENVKIEKLDNNNNVKPVYVNPGCDENRIRELNEKKRQLVYYQMKNTFLFKEGDKNQEKRDNY